MITKLQNDQVLLEKHQRNPPCPFETCEPNVWECNQLFTDAISQDVMLPEEALLHLKALYYQSDCDTSAEAGTEMPQNTSKNSQNSERFQRDNSQMVIPGNATLHLPSI